MKKGHFIKCPVCGTEKYRLPCQIGKGVKYCGHSCASKVTRNGFKKGNGGFLTEESKKKISRFQLGKIMSAETREKIRKSLTGVKHTVERRINISKGHKGITLSGPNHHNWRGGHTSETRNREMQKLEYRLWREAVFKRDDYTCQLCGVRGVNLNADHIKPYALYPELRVDISNGKTLCVPCHRKTPTWGFKTTKIKREHDERILKLP